MTSADEVAAIEALDWQTVSAYGYSHRSGWTIGRYCTDGQWETILWDGYHIHDRFPSPLAAAQYHADFIRRATEED